MNLKNVVVSVLVFSALTLLNSYPKVDLDWHTPDRNISTIGISLGGVNQIYPEDYAAAYDNPALLTMRNKTYLTGSFKSRRMEDENVSSLLTPNYLVHDKQFVYYAFSTQKFAAAYQPVMNITTKTVTDTTSQYHDLYMNSYVLSFAAEDEDFERLKLGFNLKLIDGRQVYHEEKRVDNHWEEVEFVDDTVTGYSVDAGLSYIRNSMLVGVTFYDIVSKLYWEGRDNDHLRKRFSAGLGYHNDQSTFTLATQGRLNSRESQTYHIGYGYSMGFGSMYEQTLGFKTGMYSEEYDKMSNIYYSFGLGYTVSMFTVNFSGLSRGFTLNDTDYLFSVTLGM